uniref:Gastrotropin n=1 Tax=Laticauda laticaudata TaxID=8630 RepID=A0A8C5RZX3_LATLA
MNHTTLTSLLMTAERKKPCAHCMEAWCIIQHLSLPQCLQNVEGLPHNTIEKGRNFKIITEIAQNNDEFTWSQIYPGGHTLTNTFVIGKESEMETVGGKKFKAIVRKENGKVIADFPNYHYTAEIAGDKLIEVSTVADITFKRISKKLS